MPISTGNQTQKINMGRLYLIPSPLHTDADLNIIIPPEVVKLLVNLKVLIVENTRTTRRLLRKADRSINIDDITFLEYNEHSVKSDVSCYFEHLMNGIDAGLISEAGMPCIADPGTEIVSMAHKLGIKVVPLPGTSSILMALMASGFNGQNFVFHGYIPLEKNLRSKKIRSMELESQRTGQTQIFIETPYRNNQLLISLIENCKDETLLSVSVDLTLAEQQVYTQSIKKWKKTFLDLNKRPAVFLLVAD